MNYQELQKKASSLGITAVGVKKEKLEELVKEAEAKGTPPKPSESTKEETPEEKEARLAEEKRLAEEEAEKKELKGKVNAAIVMHAGREVRRYTLEQHGKKFIDLAEEFATSRDYKLVFETVEPKIECPSCGFPFNPKK